MIKSNSLDISIKSLTRTLELVVGGDYINHQNAPPISDFDAVSELPLVIFTIECMTNLKEQWPEIKKILPQFKQWEADLRMIKDNLSVSSKVPIKRIL